jgi:hypothetical protein
VDHDAEFEFGLDLLLSGLRDRLQGNLRGRQRP